jgi:hypothetical protein
MIFSSLNRSVGESRQKLFLLLQQPFNQLFILSMRSLTELEYSRSGTSEPKSVHLGAEAAIGWSRKMRLVRH